MNPSELPAPPSEPRVIPAEVPVIPAKPCAVPTDFPESEITFGKSDLFILKCDLKKG
jgi:hypothetical protein